SLGAAAAGARLPRSHFWMSFCANKVSLSRGWPPEQPGADLTWQPAVNAVLLAGESAIVTGAGSGIGRAIAKALAHEGAGLLVTDIAGEACQAVPNETRHIGRQADCVVADLSDQEAPQRIFEAAIGRFGKVSLLIH